jgi:hypothetical protein
MLGREVKRHWLLLIMAVVLAAVAVAVWAPARVDGARAPAPANTHGVSQQLVEIGGAQGYGFWWALYMYKNGDGCSVTYIRNVYNGTRFVGSLAWTDYSRCRTATLDSTHNVAFMQPAPRQDAHEDNAWVWRCAWFWDGVHWVQTCYWDFYLSDCWEGPVHPDCGWG